MQPGVSKRSLLYGVLLFALTVASLPAELYGSNHTLTSDLFVSKRAPDFYARILPLGASITLGLRSSTGNGYRKPLRDGLRKEGWEVNMVGSKRNGNMNDNNIEAISGYHIAQIHDLFLLSSKYQPNIVLVNAGNNDAREHDDVDNAGTRLSDMIDTIFADVPGTTVVLSTIVLTANADIEAEREGLNGQIRALVTTRQANGDRIILADMAPSGSTFITASDLDGDGIHPNDGGYSKVAAIWLQAIQEADSQGLIQAPNDTIYPDEGGDDDGSNICDKEYGDGRGPVNTQAGSGLDDGIYRHVSQSMGTKLGFQRTYGDGVFWLAKITRTDRHDIVEYSETESGSSRVYQVFPSDGNGGWSTESQDLLVPDGCKSRGVRWADVTGNGLDDFLCVDTEGNTYVSTNVKSTLTSRGLFKSGASGYEQAGIHFPDIDGDGRHDYCAVAGTGDIHCWRNGGLTDLPEYWQDLGIVFTAKGMGDYLGVRFADINGDGRDDWPWLDDTGKTSIYTNNRGCTKGQEGVDGLTPLWRAAENPTHGGMGVEGARDDVFFGKVFGESQSFGLYGNADYVYLEREETEDGYLYSFNVWKNVGDGGSKLKGNATLEGFSKLAVLTLSGDGTRFCNMMGRSNGADDLVWIHSTGYVRLYESMGGEFSADPPYWGPNRIIFDETASRQMDRRDIHLADWDGDGACDIIYTDPDTGHVELWLNQILITGDFDWTYNSDPAPGVTCDQTRGVGIFDIPIHFADVSGNGKADYLCMEKDGRTKGYLHEDDGSFTEIDQFKYSEQKDRANHKFADVNGDGRADFLWTNKFNGDTDVWINAGAIPRSGSAFTWTYQGTLYEGPGQGSCMAFPDLDGNGRADFSLINSLDNTATTWFNDCPDQDGDGGGDDDDTLTSPDLPTPPGSDDDPGYLIAIVPTATITYPAATATGPPPEVTENATPIPSANSYWWIDGSCGSHTPDGEWKSDFLVQAFNDAQAIANVAKQWPNKFTEVSDLYVGKNFHNSEYKTSFKQNLVAAAEWDTHSWLPFQSYVRVSCDDSQNRCKNKIGSDPRSITAYANNTKSIFGSLVWSITACDPFFTLNHVAQIKRYHESIDPADFQLKFMESSGEKFLHEAMHLSAITEDRQHIIDSTFDGGKRIYGPKDVARAARIATRDGFDIVARNADTYAVFAQAAYWQDFYGVVIPPENARSSAAPEGALEIDDVQDSQTNYEDYVIV
ncbi:putative SGNH hydrolase-type esterase domain-containing protein [Seiridium unicorne]|uniref:SGNH hydrolase-type esterase domain-containing protein n=1 Tax=Seiridium unicorne TaxID=138068 RepID=A0ABR2UHF2_9PEZI